MFSSGKQDTSPPFFPSSIATQLVWMEPAFLREFHDEYQDVTRGFKCFIIFLHISKSISVFLLWESSLWAFVQINLPGKKAFIFIPAIRFWHSEMQSLLKRHNRSNKMSIFMSTEKAWRKLGFCSVTCCSRLETLQAFNYWLFLVLKIHHYRKNIIIPNYCIVLLHFLKSK